MSKLFSHTVKHFLMHKNWIKENCEAGEASAVKMITGTCALEWMTYTRVMLCINCCAV